MHVFVLMIGETARAKNFSLYGYERETNPLLKKEKNLIAIPDTTSCGTATALSVPCMFSAKNRKNFDLNYAKYEENVLDVIKKTGWDVIWFENDDGCKQVCNRVETRNIVKIGNNEHCFGDFCHDEALLDHLKSTLEKMEKNTLIVLHTMGSHGPSYYKRYPKEFEKFTPSCNTIDIQNCNKEELINAYDNTIAYTDYIIAKTIDLLKAHTDYETSLIYVSDHGESLGEGGLYLHGMAYKIAPEEQKTVPFFLWFSDKAITDSHIDADCLKKKNRADNSHDNLFHTMLGITGTETKLYNKDLDVTSACRK